MARPGDLLSGRGVGARPDGCVQAVRARPAPGRGVEVGNGAAMWLTGSCAALGLQGCGGVFRLGRVGAEADQRQVSLSFRRSGARAGSRIAPEVAASADRAGRGFRFGDGGGLRRWPVGEMPLDDAELGGAVRRRPESPEADAMESRWRDVLQESAQEVDRWHGGASFARRGIVGPPEEQRGQVTSRLTSSTFR